jgi:translocation and assembly module TamA
MAERTTKPRNWVRGGWAGLRELVANWNKHGAAAQSAALAFYTLFSLAPVLVVVIAVAGAVFGEEAVRGQIVAEFSGLMGRDAASLIQNVIRSAARPASGRIAAVLGIFTLLFGASGVFAQLQEALNRVWDVAPRPGAVFTTLLRKRLLSFSLVLGIGFLLMVSLVLSAALSALGSYLERFAVPAAAFEIINFAASFLGVTLLFGLIYRLLPDVHLAWRDVGTGAVLTALLFVLGKTLIGLYLGRTGLASAYGAAGSLVVVLLWVYYSALVFFLGAELTRILSRKHRTGKAKPEAGAMRVPPELAGAKAPSPEDLQRLAGVPDRSDLNRRGRTLAVGAILLLAFAGPVQAAEKLRIKVEGVDGDLRRNVLATLSLQEARKDKHLTEEKIRRLHSRAAEEVQTALEPFGYYRPSVQSSLERDGSTWVARYRIDPGPPIRLTGVDVRVDGPGAGDPGFRERMLSFPLHTGDVLYHPGYDVGKQAFVDYAAAQGYLDAAYTVNEIRVDQAAYTAAIVLHFNTGPAYLFGPVSFQQDFLDPDILRGYVTFKEGERLDVNKLLDMQVALSDSPYFQRVEVLPRQDQAKDLRVPIEVDLLPAKRQRWTAGIGYGTDTGPRGRVGLELRRINRHGHRGQVEIKGSEIEKSFITSYQIPGPYPRTDVISFDAGYADLQPRESERTKSGKVAASLSQSRGRWRETYSLGFQRDDFTIGLDKGTSHLFLPQVSWSLVQADDRIYTTHGQRVQIDLRAADRSVLSNASFVQGKVEGTLIRSFGNRFRFLSRAQVGQTETSDFHDLPPTIRFFAGGDQSVRGYAYHQLGEKDAAGNVIGGRALLTGSAELEVTFLQHWRFLDKIGVAGFYDAGNAMPSLSSGSLEQGAGFGLRAVSPIGPIRLDAAFALTEPGHPMRIHFTVGPDL